MNKHILEKMPEWYRVVEEAVIEKYRMKKYDSLYGKQEVLK